MVRTPEGIKKDVVDSLFWDTRVDASHVKVAVDGGVVPLSGSVPSFEARHAAQEEAWILVGVEEVRNEIAVRILDPEPPCDDAELLDRIQCVLAWDEVGARGTRLPVLGEQSIIPPRAVA